MVRNLIFIFYMAAEMKNVYFPQCKSVFCVLLYVLVILDCSIVNTISYSISVFEFEYMESPLLGSDLLPV